MNKRFNVVCCGDGRFISRMGVMLTSLFSSNKNNAFDVFVITDDLSPINRRKFLRLESKYGTRNVINIIDIPANLKKRFLFPCNGHFSSAICYRFLVPILLPDNVDRVLYLDGDIIVNGDISNIFDFDMTGKAAAMVRNCTNYDDNNIYFNSGVCLMNLDYWRKSNIGELCLNSIMEYWPSHIFLDQDILNDLLKGSILSLPITYNLQYPFICGGNFCRFSNDFQKEIENASRNPRIIHYCGPAKPWQFIFLGRPYCNLWLDAQMHSYWKFDYSFKPLKKVVKHSVKFIFWSLGLMRYKMGVEDFVLSNRKISDIVDS